MTKVCIDNPIFKKFSKAFQYAMEKTTIELNQAVEGLYHNLNTLDILGA